MPRNNLDVEMAERVASRLSYRKKRWVKWIGQEDFKQEVLLACVLAHPEYKQNRLPYPYRFYYVSASNHISNLVRGILHPNNGTPRKVLKLRQRLERPSFLKEEPPVENDDIGILDAIDLLEFKRKNSANRGYPSYKDWLGMSYRKDNRDHKTFCDDIKKATKTEREILDRWLAILAKKYGKTPVVVNNGCNNSGKYLEDADVTIDEDYIIDDILTEIKFSYMKLKDVFHFKTPHVDRYLKNKSTILFVDGWNTAKPMYTVIGPEILERVVAKAEKVMCYQFGGKEAYRFRVDDLLWKEFACSP